MLPKLNGSGVGLKSWMKISAAVLITAMICVPVTATVMGSSSYMLNVAGSTTVQPLMMELQKEFEKFAKVEMNVTGGGSGVGVSSTLNGVANIGMLSRDLTPEEKKKGLVVHPIALDAVVVVINTGAGLTVPDLTMEELLGIYNGTILNWNELGGADKSIKVIAREQGSGSRECFDNAMKKEAERHGIEYRLRDGVLPIISTNMVLTTVNNTDGAIGYVNYNVAHGHGDRTMTVSLNGIEADDADIKDGTYPISRTLILVTKDEPTEMIKFFIDWILSEDGQRIVEESGFVRWK